MTSRINEIATVLTLAGEWAHGGDPVETAREWASLGFNSAQVEAWTAVGVWDPDTAETADHLGLSPDELVEAAELLIEDGYDRWTGKPIYDCCNGDLAVADLADMIER